MKSTFNFCIIYKAIDKFIPKGNAKFKKEKLWFNVKCMEVKDERDLLWERFRRLGVQGTFNKCKKAKNEYSKIRRQVQVEHEKDIVDKCKS